MYHVWLYRKNHADRSEDRPVSAWYSYKTLAEALHFCNHMQVPHPESQTWDIHNDSGKLVSHLAWNWETD